MHSCQSRIRTVALGLLATPCLVHGPEPTEWPLDRIVANLEARLAQSPDDAYAHYCLGRAYGFAFALERSSLLLYEQQRGLTLEELAEQRKLTNVRQQELA